MDISEAKKILETCMDKLGVDVARTEVSAGDPHPFLSVTTRDSAMLIGVQGENLRALNYVVKRIVESKSEKVGKKAPSFLVDINGYHRKHVAGLKQQARILAERARTFKADVPMPPLNAYERMIVHAGFSDDPEITTESSGVGKNRHIVFKYKKEEASLSASDKALFTENEPARS